MRKQSILYAVLLSAAVSLIFALAVMAASNTGSQRRLNFWEGIDAYAWKKVETNAGNTKFRGRIRSYTEGGIVWRLGWNWWSVQEWCGGSPIASHQYPGHVQYDANNAASTSPYYVLSFCGYRHQGKTNGKHDFKYGPALWQPNFTVTLNLP